MSIVYQQPPKNYLYQIGLVNVVDNEFVGFNFGVDLVIQFQVTSGNAGDTSTQHFITSNVQ